MQRFPAAVCVGETMAALIPDGPGPLEGVGTFHHTIGGAEANVARGLVALGVPTAWAGRVGDDGFGRRIVRELANAGIDTSGVEVDPVRPTGLYVKETGPAGSVLHYYRKGSAGSALGPGLLGSPLLANARLVHLSGITPALSAQAFDLVRAILDDPVPGRTISFDLNWRPTLWSGRDPSPLRSLVNAADIALMGADEAAEVFGTGDPRALRELLPGPGTLVVKDDAHQATAITVDTDVTAGGQVTEIALRVDVVEPVGAGDAFAAGYLAGTLRGYDQRRCLRLGHIAAASTLVVPGDHGAPPAPDVVDALLAATAGEWAAVTVSASGLDLGSKRETR
ncbi:sugar kinase [Actinomadura barringtoniae]|uniref:Sugar kinase n=1 Tax=Actinomadura barringtoniae TaxID=1427535 RepID=A0A939TE38_9ACTN|nr:sugar kinase [Actinomadura barringtoniae]MBO2452935.1 sugar kinase [Actinomadura barringtoniae]